MSNKKFIIADVFTDTQFGGNQLAVYLDGNGLDKATMQNIAREMNYSETTFLLPPESSGDFRVRIFTPHEELPFAGHPLVGSGFVIVAQKMKAWSAPSTNVRLETGVGEIVIKVDITNDQPGFTEMTQPLPVVQSVWTDTARLAKALALAESDIASTNLPVQVLFNGIPVLMIPVASLQAVARIKVDAAGLADISHEAGAKTVMAFTMETLLPSSTVHCRVFAPVEGILEDAATGSANGPLGFYLVAQKLVEVQPITRIISEQGFEMHRPSILKIAVEKDEASQQIAAIHVGGNVVISGQGELFV
ncbi:MAG: PhzF family phenazine biosynthesis protein [Acidobacteria bacterium]|nr:PhzF family phenazine biosynthesis protein [Acidobacteriota bacterium]